MSMYPARFTLTPSTWATLIDKPEDRRQALEPVIAAVGGKLHGFCAAPGIESSHAVTSAGSAVARR